MKVSEIDANTIATYIRVDLTSETEPFINMALDAAIEYCTTYTGLTKEELDRYADIPMAVLALCAEFYDLRQFTASEVMNVNPTTEQILSSYSVNLL